MSSWSAPRDTSSAHRCSSSGSSPSTHLIPLLLHLSYFLAVDLLGFLALVLLRPSSPAGSYRPRVTSTCSSCPRPRSPAVTGLATVEMEDLSSAQVIVLTLLMLLGSEIFVSLLGLVLESSSSPKRRQQQREHQDHDSRRVMAAAAVCDGPDLEEANDSPAAAPSTDSSGDGDGRESCRVVGSLALVVSACMAAILVAGSLLVFAYVATVPTARDVLARKPISTALFSVTLEQRGPAALARASSSRPPQRPRRATGAGGGRGRVDHGVNDVRKKRELKTRWRSAWRGRVVLPLPLQLVAAAEDARALADEDHGGCVAEAADTCIVIAETGF